ncbi:CBS domain-containing protein [Mucilaginibacter myungsuensis]
MVKTIREALANQKLETFPDFNSAYIDGLIEFRKKGTLSQVTQASTIEADDKQVEIRPEKLTDELLNLDDPTYRISRLEAANKDLIFVKPDGELMEAVTLMMTYDFSQLPVMQHAKRDLKGVISWQSIGQKLAVGKVDSKVRNLMDTNYQLISSETSLFKALPGIIEHDYVLIQNREKEICGIVTASDLSLQFKQLTEPFLLVAEIENHVRQILMKLSKEELANGKDERDVNRKVDTVADLNFGEYLRLCQNQEIWNKLGLSIDRKAFCTLLDSVRDIRNNIMHFDPDGLEQSSTETLRSFVRLLQKLRSLNVF